jgi:hypothetical protein
LALGLSLGCAAGDNTGSSFTGSNTFGGEGGTPSGGTSAGTADDDDGATSMVGGDGGSGTNGAASVGGNDGGSTDGGGDNDGPGCVPAAEVCDGLDNDCNGVADDNPSDAGAPCATGMPGVCADGVTACNANTLDCVVSVGASAESCDGVDNDCDGAVDNGNPGGGGACSTGLQGICSAGTQQCSGGAVTCMQNQAAAGAEACGNGLDDNCNGAVDEGCNTCNHDICLAGVALVAGCDPCVTQICGVDPFCCSNSWDGLCVDEVGSVCGIVC